MALRTDYTDSTATATEHPNHHNALAAAVNSLSSLTYYSASYEVTAAQSNYTFTAIPRTVKRLHLTVSGRSDSASASTTCTLRFGGDTTAVYSNAFQFIQNGPTASQISQTNATSLSIGYLLAAGTSGTRNGSISADITGWNLPTGRTSSYLGVNFQGGFIVGTTYLTVQGAGEYFGTATLDNLTVLSSVGSFAAGSQFTLLGTY